MDAISVYMEDFHSSRRAPRGCARRPTDEEQIKRLPHWWRRYYKARKQAKRLRDEWYSPKS